MPTQINKKNGGSQVLLKSSYAFPPAGCDADAIKIFVGNIPKVFNEVDLLPLFEEIGDVVELVIVRDKAKHSKGSAFVWYRHARHAREAIATLNGLSLLFSEEQADLNSKYKGPLEVREALPGAQVNPPSCERVQPQVSRKFPRQSSAPANVLPSFLPPIYDSSTSFNNNVFLNSSMINLPDEVTASVVLKSDQITSVLNSSQVIEKLTNTVLGLNPTTVSRQWGCPPEVQFCLTITGSSFQVLAAQTLFESVLAM